MKSFAVALFGLFTITSIAQVNLSNSLVACYAFNGDAVEPINNLTGTLSIVTPTVDRQNTPFRALYFEGSAFSHVKLPDDTLLKSNAISFSAWVMALPGNFPQPWILYTGSTHSITSEAYSLAFENVSGGKKLRVRKRNAGSVQGVTTATVLSNNVWYHVCFTMDNSAIKLYLNGVMQGSVTCTIPFSYATGKHVYLGSSNEANQHQPFAGLMDNVRFYKRVLSPAEVTSLYILDPVCVTATVPPVAAFVTLDSIYCSGSPIQFLDKSLNYPTSWVWGAPGAVSNNVLTANPSLTFSVAGNYTVTLNASNLVGTSTSTMAITINSTPTISASVQPTLVCRYEGGTVTATGASSYTWSPGSGVGSPLFINPYSQTVYTVSGTDSIGCVGTNTLLVRVWICDHWPPVSVHEHTAFFKITVAPNPNSGLFDIVFDTVGSCEYQLTNFLGHKILSGKIDSLDKISIVISDYPAGLYFLNIYNSNGSKTIKLLKE